VAKLRFVAIATAHRQSLRKGKAIVPAGDDTWPPGSSSGARCASVALARCDDYIGSRLDW
jgi:hypothetical protein